VPNRSKLTYYGHRTDRPPADESDEFHVRVHAPSFRRLAGETPGLASIPVRKERKKFLAE